MGGAYAAATQDTSALIWNPAGLAGLSTPEIAIGYLDLHGVLGYSFIGVAHPIRKGQSVGAAILNSSDTEGISHERIVLLSAAIRIWKRLHIGLNAKYFSTSVNLEQVPLGSGRGWGADFGVQYIPMTDRVRIGVVFPNLFSNLSYRRLEENTTDGKYEEPLLREWRIGTAVKINLGSGTPDSLLAAVEIANSVPLIGCEYRNNVKHGDFALRLGWRFTRGFTAGFGYQHGNIGLDYAFVMRDTVRRLRYFQFGFSTENDLTSSYISHKKLGIYTTSIGLKKLDCVRKSLQCIRRLNPQHN